MIPYEAVGEDEDPPNSEKYCGMDLKTKDGYCDSPPSYSDGHCGNHTETLTRSAKPNAPETQVPNPQGKFPQTRSTYYNELPDEEKAMVDGVVNDFLQDAPFDPDHKGKMKMLRGVAIDMHKKELADEYISYEGMSVEENEGYHEEFGPIQNDAENPLHLTSDRLTRTNIKTLKELGILGESPDNKQAEATEGILDVLSSLDEEEDDAITVESTEVEDSGLP